MAGLSFLIIAVELLIIVIFQKYSSHVDEILDYPSLLQEDFNNEQLLKSGNTLVFFYASGVLFAAVLFNTWLLLATLLKSLQSRPLRRRESAVDFLEHQTNPNSHRI